MSSTQSKLTQIKDRINSEMGQSGEIQPPESGVVYSRLHVYSAQEVNPTELKKLAKNFRESKDIEYHIHVIPQPTNSNSQADNAESPTRKEIS